jgi:hypothetical protein
MTTKEVRCRELSGRVLARAWERSGIDLNVTLSTDLPPQAQFAGRATRAAGKTLSALPHDADARGNDHYLPRRLSITVRACAADLRGARRLHPDLACGLFERARRGRRAKFEHQPLALGDEARALLTQLLAPVAVTHRREALPDGDHETASHEQPADEQHDLSPHDAPVALTQDTRVPILCWGQPSHHHFSISGLNY